MILRVFPRRTAATPDDDLAFVGLPPLPGLRPSAQSVRQILISATFTWDKRAALLLAKPWLDAYPESQMLIGGPAFDDAGGEFSPGLFLRRGYTITSRGCIRACPWCLAAKREGAIRELPIREGYDVLDNNLLACSRWHVDAVLDMLERQPRPARFTGGLDARLLVERPDLATRIARGRLDVAYVAYDSPAAWPVTERAVKMLLDAGGWGKGQGRRKIGVYVLVGFDPWDTEMAAVDRAGQVVEAGATPFLMVYRPPASEKSQRLESLKRSLRRWMRPSRIFAAQE